MRRKIVSAGHICLDITPAFLHGAPEGIGKVLTPGQLVQTGAADIHTGGSVANTGLALRFFGAETVLMGKVGDDAFGAIVQDLLAPYGANMRVAEGEATSYSVVLAVPGCDRIFLHHSGANDSFTADDLDYAAIADACLFHFGYPTIMCGMFDNGGAALTEIFRRVKVLGTATSMDMAAIDVKSPAGQADWDGILRRTLPYVDFFVPSVEELLYMLDKPKLAALSARAGGDVTEALSIQDDIVPLAAKALSYGAGVVLIKCGARGLYVAAGCSARLADIGGGLGADLAGWCDMRHFEASFMPEKVVSATGAGDTCIAAFLVAVTQGLTLRECAAMAAAAGACCVTAYDALSGLIPFEKMRAKMAAGWEKRVEYSV